MLENIMSGVTLAGITSLAFIAYNHGERFREVSPWLGIGTIVVGLGLWLWQGAIMSVEVGLSGAQVYEQWESISPVLDGLKIEMWLVAGWMPVTFLYLVILHVWVSRLKD